MSKRKIIVFAACLALLLALQIKFVLPYVNKIVASDLFLEESKDEASPLAISNDMTKLAITFCNHYIRSRAESDTTLQFADRDVKSWSQGNYDYIVKADVQIAAPNTPNQTYHYVCRIQYQYGDDTSHAQDSNSWSIGGVDGLPDDY